MITLYTIEGSGSHSLQKFLRTHQLFHCNACLDWSEHFDVHSTFRDPYLVGATWANRYMRPLDSHPRHDIGEIWRRSWANWSRAARRMTIHNAEDIPYVENSSEDRTGAHQAYKEGDMKAYYQLIPKAFIDFANDCVRRAYG